MVLEEWAGAPFTWPVQLHQFLLEEVVEQFIPMLAEKDKYLGSPDAAQDLFFLRAQLNRGLAYRWLHIFAPCRFSSSASGRANAPLNR